MSALTNKCTIWLCVAFGLAILGAANWHLVYVATASQPDCVAHLRVGAGDGARGLYSAAKSSCTPRETRPETK
jgi:hypothetical protein